VSAPLPVNINKTQTKKRVLVAPLDWGLGHATRCIPLISELLAGGFEVLIAADQKGGLLLATEFPTLKILPLQGYEVRYSRSRHFFFIKMVFQSGKVKSAIKNEHAWLKKIVSVEGIDIVISDNRFGLFHKGVHCIFMTHQLFIKTGNSLTEKMAQKINYRYVNRFNECWVPDAPGEENLAGELSHPEKKTAVPLRYIGALSRFTRKEKEKNIDILALVSGPEPQRSVFEEVLSAQLTLAGGNNILVRGLPGNHSLAAPQHHNLRVFDHLPANELNDLMLSAKIIIAASGYSTVMDLAALQQNAILIPTPGQKEQEYLAHYLSEKNYCITCAREELDLQILIKQFRETTFRAFPPVNNILLKEAISSLQ
jgi:predicted glycosyltransferase